MYHRRYILDVVCENLKYVEQKLLILKMCYQLNTDALYFDCYVLIIGIICEVYIHLLI